MAARYVLQSQAFAELADGSRSGDLNDPKIKDGYKRAYETVLNFL